jgi:hypothetical protein
MRRQGQSYGEIMDLTPVKNSTLATWCNSVPLTEEQITTIRLRRAPEPGIPRDTQRKRRREIEELREIPREEVPFLADDPSWVAGLILYWAEGNKTRSQVGMASADPRALMSFIRWIRTYVDPGAESTIHLHLHEGNDEFAAKRYWANETGLAEAHFVKNLHQAQGGRSS